MRIIIGPRLQIAFEWAIFKVYLLSHYTLSPSLQRLFARVKGSFAINPKYEWVWKILRQLFERTRGMLLSSSADFLLLLLRFVTHLPGFYFNPKSLFRFVLMGDE